MFYSERLFTYSCLAVVVYKLFLLLKGATIVGTGRDSAAQGGPRRDAALSAALCVESEDPHDEEGRRGKTIYIYLLLLS